MNARIRISNALTSVQHCFKLRSAAVVLTGFDRTSGAYPIGPAERTTLQGNDAVGGADRFQTVCDHDPGNVERGQRPVHLALLFHIQMRSSLVHEQDARLAV